MKLTNVLERYGTVVCPGVDVPGTPISDFVDVHFRYDTFRSDTGTIRQSRYRQITKKVDKRVY